MKTIAQLLQITDFEYEALYFDAYWRWCESVTINALQLQMVMANTSVNKYYNTEYAKCETEFRELCAMYPDASEQDAIKMYKRCTVAMFNRHSKVLVEQAKKTQIINHLIAN